MRGARLVSPHPPLAAWSTIETGVHGWIPRGRPTDSDEGTGLRRGRLLPPMFNQRGLGEWVRRLRGAQGADREGERCPMPDRDDGFPGTWAGTTTRGTPAWVLATWIAQLRRQRHTRGRGRPLRSVREE